MPKKATKTYIQFKLSTDTLGYSFSYNDEETAALHLKVNNNPEIDINDLRRVSLWKIDRVLGVSDETLDKLRSLAQLDDVLVTDPFVEGIVDDLVNSQGIGYPMASAILKFIKPEVFPIIDVRAYRALRGLKPYYSTYTYQKYVDYTNDLIELAKTLNRPLREMDEQLYCFDQEMNGKI
jgi:hypothetical protein